MSAAAQVRHRASAFRQSAEVSGNPLVRLMHQKAVQRRESYDGSAPAGAGLVRQQRAYCV